MKTKFGRSSLLLFYFGQHLGLLSGDPLLQPLEATALHEARRRDEKLSPKVRLSNYIPMAHNHDCEPHKVARNVVIDAGEKFLHCRFAQIQ